MTTAGDIKAMIVSLIEPSLVAGGRAAVALTDETDLRADGLIDSLGFVQLLAGLEQRLGGPVDLGDLEPERLTNIGALSRHIALSRTAAQESKP
jgi:acyl carrier protein